MKKIIDIDWEGAELCYYFNGESHSIDLTDMQFAIITKILGLRIQPDGSVICFSDESLNNIANMKGNPLHLIRK